MMDQAALLREYNTALHEKRTRLSLRRASDSFWRSHHLTAALTDASSRIIAAHRERVAGNGSPAACDTALNEALRSIGP